MSSSASNRTRRRLTINAEAQEMIDLARQEGLETVRDRLAAPGPQCGRCQLALSCRSCLMGFCRIDPFGEGPEQGACGADGDPIVALVSAEVSRPGRRRTWAIGETSGYRIADETKLRALASDLGIEAEGPSILELAEKVATAIFEGYGSRKL